ncbi:hypothetical protein [Brevibacillus laterosporus]|uniref:Uncharacterized protein n=1 Tax=Brevibacillus laterosporus TaxID=1465 RepID=A0AAP3GD84_BRELA|nr:hypothetical protein [Brevibacillus laterosporus]MCR8982649.1 hypothetical protein [Brevibacillus laterosporus]MCZ0809805.1 hypothetical protein [Brevibacillus laterosporus]MCZ0828361.1 hypothetical protein [Brevibacillus laterosporus]MCZ0852371.1 hypothetical protein [Brevibacillus laterosporus]
MSRVSDTKKGKFAITLCAIEQSPKLTPDVIPKGVKVEILRMVEHGDFYSGTGYIIFWPEQYYADVVDVLEAIFEVLLIGNHGQIEINTNRSGQLELVC